MWECGFNSTLTPIN